MTEKPTFIMYKSWNPLFKNLPKEQAAELICAVYDYQTTGEVDIEDAAVRAMFEMMRETMDADAAKYEETCKRNKKAVNKRWEKKRNEEDVIQKDAHVYERIQPNTKHTDSDSDSDSEYDSDNDINNNTPSKTERVRVPYQEIIDKYNSICVSMPKVTRLTDSRKRAIRGRCSEYSLSEFDDMFHKAEGSDFYSGRSGKWAGCNFDWLMKPSNFIKVLELKEKGNGIGNKEPPRLFADEYI